MKTRSRGSPVGGTRSAALVIAPTWTPSAALEGAGLALFGEGAGGLVEVLAEIELQGRGLHDDLALELLHVPAAGAHRRADREWWVLRDFGRQLAGDLEMLALLCHAVDEPGRKRLLRREEAAGQCHLVGESSSAAEIQQCPIFRAAEAARGL